MSRIFITGSADGLGKLAAAKLVENGHEVVVHARNAQRAEDAWNNVRGAKEVLIADLSDLEETRNLANEVNALGTFDAIIHNAGVYQASSRQILTVNTLAPYILTCLIHKPKRLVYLSSGLHLGGNPDLNRLENNRVNYSDSKLHDLILAKAVARKWKEVYSNAVDPGWVPTKMGGKGATGDLQKGFETQVWLAESKNITLTGDYLYHKRVARYFKEADNNELQDQFLEKCRQITGVAFPR
jgi:NAD(P)-dependent dehydrogenase (short-subunit alcohol dehydrogenase family)